MFGEFCYFARSCARYTVALFESERVIGWFQFNKRPQAFTAVDMGFQEECIRIHLDARAQPPEVWLLMFDWIRMCSILIEVLLAQRDPYSPDEGLIIPDNRDFQAATNEEIFIEKNAMVRG